MDFGPQQFGKWLVAAGAVIIAIGLLVILLGKVGLFRLPGDLSFGGRNWRIYFPIASSLTRGLRTHPTRDAAPDNSTRVPATTPAGPVNCGARGASLQLLIVLGFAIR